ncbi:MAG: DUF4292 domain-containing protein [Myxococcales bacterium]|nr:DUF4292 domain-containing protein [Myxococcales bacterium]
MRARSIAWLLLLPLAGCPKPVALRPYPLPSSSGLLAQVRQSQGRVQSLKLYGKADVPDDNGGRVKLDIAVAVQRPAKLRLSAESTLAGPLLTLATDGERYQLLDTQQNRYLSSVVTPCSMARLLRVSLPPTMLAEVLSGGVPLLAGDALQLESDWDQSEGGREVVRIRDGLGRKQVLYLQAQQQAQLPGTERAFDVVQTELFGTDGKPFLRIRHQRFAVVEPASPPAQAAPPIRLPKLSSIEDLVGKSEVKLRWKESEVNVPLAAELFYLAQPPGIPSDPDPCMATVPSASP